MSWLKNAMALLCGGKSRVASDQSELGVPSLLGCPLVVTPDETGANALTAALQPAERVTPPSTSTGVPDEREEGRAVRVFLSSTFLDMHAERDELRTTTFPALRRRFRDRGVVLLEVDLRWGVVESDVTLQVCLSEVERCRPWFIALLGQRYGTVLTEREATPELQEAFPVVRKGIERSLTEIEILQCLLTNPRNAKCALFFERDPTWLDTLRGEQRAAFEDQSKDARAKLGDLKARIRRVATVRNYKSPVDIGPAVEAALGSVLEARFPQSGAPDTFTQTHRLHAAYARDRLGLHIGAARYLERLNQWMQNSKASPLLIAGPSGSGKSKLIANWIQVWRTRPWTQLIASKFAWSRA